MSLDFRLLVLVYIEYYPTHHPGLSSGRNMYLHLAGIDVCRLDKGEVHVGPSGLWNTWRDLLRWLALASESTSNGAVL